MKYIHFTSPEDAQKIAQSKQLWKSSYVDGIFAVVAGSRSVPDVQFSKLGRTKDRSTAVVFETDELPDVAFPEEVIWHMDVLPIKNPQVMPAQKAVEMLTDTIPTNSDDWLQIPVHPSKMDMSTFTRVRLPLKAHEAAAHQVAANMQHQERLRKLRR